MSACVIFCAGEMEISQIPIGEDDLVIAADGGLRHARRLGIRPQILLGDFDSLGYVPEGAQVFPVEKDDTDAMLAVRKGLELGFDRFRIYGGMEGPRLDHTVANLQTLCFLAEHGALGFLIGKHQTAVAIKNSGLRFPAGATGTLSVFCMGKDAHGVTLQGLKYPLTDGTLTAAFPLGVSNRFTGAAAQVSVTDGTLLVLFPREVWPC